MTHQHLLHFVVLQYQCLLFVSKIQKLKTKKDKDKNNEDNLCYSVIYGMKRKNNRFFFYILKSILTYVHLATHP